MRLQAEFYFLHLHTASWQGMTRGVMKRTALLRLLLLVMAVTFTLPSCKLLPHKRTIIPQPPPGQPTPTPTPKPPNMGLLSHFHFSFFPSKQKKTTPRALVPLWIGTITMVNLETHFVLIDSNAFYAVVPGKQLSCISQSRETGKVVVSKDKNPPFFIADIVSGSPQVGDRVYSQDHP